MLKNDIYVKIKLFSTRHNMFADMIFMKIPCNFSQSSLAYLKFHIFDPRGIFTHGVDNFEICKFFANFRKIKIFIFEIF